MLGIFMIHPPQLMSDIMWLLSTVYVTVVYEVDADWTYCQYHKAKNMHKMFPFPIYTIFTSILICFPKNSRECVPW